MRAVSASTHALDRVRSFFSARIWAEHLEELSRFQAFLYRVSRVAYAAVRGFFENGLTFRAAALTYFSVLSLVPFLAFAFAVLKGFGAYRTFIDGTLRPYLADTFSANPDLLHAIEQILHFVDQTDVSKLGAVGLLLLVYTSVTLVSNVEVSLNAVWGVRKTRPFLRQVTDYVTLLVTTPLLVLVATTFSTAAQSSSVVLFLRERLDLGGVIDFVLGFTPIAVVGVALFGMYMILPNVRTRVSSALLGAAFAAVLWHGALILHVQMQMGVAKYNALYSVLGSIPIFLVWMYMSWLIVLVGAQLAAAHQNEHDLRQRFHASRVDQGLREALAVAVMAQVARDFVQGGPRRSHAELAALLAVPAPIMDEILDTLARGGVAARTLSGGDIGWVPGGDVDRIRMSDVLEALRHDPVADPLRADVGRQLGPELERLLADVREEKKRSALNRTLRELAALAPDATRTVARGGRASIREAKAPGRGDVVDAKQPDVPA